MELALTPALYPEEVGLMDWWIGGWWEVMREVWRENQLYARPHPGPLPRGEGEPGPARLQLEGVGWSREGVAAAEDGPTPRTVVALSFLVFFTYFTAIPHSLLDNWEAS